METDVLCQPSSNNDEPDEDEDFRNGEEFLEKFKGILRRHYTFRRKRLPITIPISAAVVSTLMSFKYDKIPSAEITSRVTTHPPTVSHARRRRRARTSSA